MPAKLILASNSASRKSLMTGAGLAFDTEAADVDERGIETDLAARHVSPPEIAMALAEAKALDVGAHADDATVIGADQTLDADGRRWIKPASMDEARDQLVTLAGRSHKLQTAVAGVRDGAIRWRHLDSATLTLRPLTPDAIDRYLDTVGEAALGSVGAYQIEGPGIQLFERIEGDFFTILGLPILPLLAWLRAEGALE